MISDGAPTLLQQHMTHVYNICALIAYLTVILVLWRVRKSEIKPGIAILILGIAETSWLGTLIANMIIQGYGFQEALLGNTPNPSGVIVSIWITHFCLYTGLIFKSPFKLSFKETALTIVVLCTMFTAFFLYLYTMQKIPDIVAGLISGSLSLAITLMLGSWLNKRHTSISGIVREKSERA
jgi:hypothetical protein